VSETNFEKAAQVRVEAQDGELILWTGQEGSVLARLSFSDAERAANELNAALESAAGLELEETRELRGRLERERKERAENASELQAALAEAASLRSEVARLTKERSACDGCDTSIAPDAVRGIYCADCLGAHERITSILNAAGVETPDGTSVGTAREAAALIGRLTKERDDWKRRWHEQVQIRCRREHEMQRWTKNAPHEEIDDCPTYYDGCNCTVENLAHNIRRAEEAERNERANGSIRNEAERLQHEAETKAAALRIQRDALLGACEGEIKGAPESEPVNPESDNHGDTFDYACNFAHYHTAKRLRAVVEEARKS
jgi:hypothetical protein